jgi:hypothetical protein
MNNEELIEAGRRVRKEEKHFFSSAAKPKRERWKSPEYQRAIKFRKDVSTNDPIVIEGYEGPQPG